MGRHKMTKGICRICGEHKKLSFEHVPPRVAFNRHTKYVSIEFEDYIKSRNLLKDIPKGKMKQGGIGYNSFCEKCNNFLGSNYVNAYKIWVNAGLQLLVDSEFAACHFELINIQPLPVLKQIISMFLAINDPEFIESFPELSEFVQNKNQTELPDKFQIYTYLTRAERFRYMNYCAKNNLENGKTIQCSEIAFPPFGYVITFNSKLDISYLNNITAFKNYNFDNLQTFKMTLAQLPTYTIYPLDYRGKEKLNNDIENAQELMNKIDELKSQKIT
jgi:hypothetical protein